MVGGASAEGGGRGTAAANEASGFSARVRIGRREIIVRIWEAGYSRRMFFYLLCVVLNGPCLSVSGTL